MIIELPICVNYRSSVPRALVQALLTRYSVGETIVGIEIVRTSGSDRHLAELRRKPALSSAPCRRLQPSYAQHSIRVALSSLKALLASYGSDAMSSRDAALVWVAYGAGLGASELLVRRSRSETAWRR